MNKEEILNDEFVEREIVQSKSHKKIKIAASIVASLIIIATTTLLVGHFKFDWFKNEVYTLDTKISHNLYQVNYFTETKNIKTKIGFVSGVTDNQEHTIYTNFMVMITGKEGFLNTAILVILDTKAKFEKEFKNINTFDIFDEAKIKEVIANPDGSKYPLGVFSFYDNGTIVDIKLPNNMDEYHANEINELIENVIPKLSRNRTEDISNGLDIKTKKDKKKSTIVETQNPIEVPEMEGSKFVKSVERDIENEQITNIRAESNVALESEPNSDEEVFGIKDFYLDQKVEIVSTGIKEEKKTAEKLLELSKHFTFIKSEDLLELFTKKENGDHENVVEEYLGPDSQLRNLAINLDKTIKIKEFTVLKTKITISVRIGASNSKAFGEIIVTAGNARASFGTNGVQASYQRTWSGELTIFRFQFPPLPIIGIALKAGGSVGVSARFDSNAQTKLSVTVTASLYAKAEVVAGWDKVASVSAGAKGTIVSASLTGGITNTGLTKSGKITAGTISVYVDGYLFGWNIFHHDWTVFNGWSASF